MFKLLAFLEPESLHDFRHPIGRAEVPHEIVFETDVKSRAARITLARATSAQLPIDPARFVALGADNKQSAPVGHAFAELNVGAAAGHVRRNRNRSRLARALDDLSFLHVEFR